MRTAARPEPTCRRRPRGFSLIELMIAIAVIGILAAIALPSYQDSVRKSRRSEAFAAITSLQQAQERWRSNHPQFSTTLSELGWSTDMTATGLYQVRLESSAEPGDTLATAYVVSADGQAGTSQAADAECRKLSLRVRGGNVEYAGCGSCTTHSYAATNRCWAR